MADDPRKRSLIDDIGDQFHESKKDVVAVAGFLEQVFFGGSAKPKKRVARAQEERLLSEGEPSEKPKKVAVEVLSRGPYENPKQLKR